LEVSMFLADAICKQLKPAVQKQKTKKQLAIKFKLKSRRL